MAVTLGKGPKEIGYEAFGYSISLVRTIMPPCPEGLLKLGVDAHLAKKKVGN